MEPAVVRIGEVDEHLAVEYRARQGHIVRIATVGISARRAALDDTESRADIRLD